MSIEMETDRIEIWKEAKRNTSTGNELRDDTKRRNCLEVLVALIHPLELLLSRTNAKIV